MYIPHDSVADANMRWGHCVVRVNIDGALVPLYIEQIEAINKDSVTIAGSIRNGDSWMPTHAKYLLQNINTRHPKMGYVNKGPHAILLRRIARYRQYRLGFCANRMSFMVPNRLELASINIPVRTNVLESVNYLFDRKYPDVPSAIKDVSIGRVFSVAVSPTIALGLSAKTKGPGIYRNNNLIGGVNSSKEAELPYHHRYFREELEQLGLTVNLVGGTNGQEAE